MAVVAGKPFLFHLFEYLTTQNCTRVILSLGFKHEYVLEWLKENNWNFEIDYVIEEEPLGTGGGISLALTKARKENIFVLNGDTMFGVDFHSMLDFHCSKNAHLTLALKVLQNFERYGVVRVDEKKCVQSFEEKKQYALGTINGGVYILNKAALFQKKLPQKYSFEKDYLEHFVDENTFYGFLSEAYFIDIGVPADFQQAQIDFSK
jgi:D-glycero-alpha-D-manno-heptose 1-phosphate guanylyltransferase